MIASFRYIRAKIVNSLTDNYSKCYNRKSMKVFIREKKVRILTWEKFFTTDLND